MVFESGCFTQVLLYVIYLFSRAQEELTEKKKEVDNLTEMLEERQTELHDRVALVRSHIYKL